MQPFGEKLVAGDTWSWSVNAITLDDVDYTSAEWTLKYFFRGQNATLDVTATAAASASGWEISVAGDASTGTGKLKPGTCSWMARLIYIATPTKKIELGRGTVEILADVESAGGDYDGRSFVKRTLDAIRAVLEGRASRVETEYEIAGRSLRLMSPSELLELEGEFAARYNRELVESGQRSGRSSQILARFA